MTDTHTMALQMWIVGRYFFLPNDEVRAVTLRKQVTVFAGNDENLTSNQKMRILESLYPA